jgi:hypothetical protein
MRIVEDRYEGELENFHLALRFVRYEARTRTIRIFTGLTDHRIRKLWQRYCGGARELPRHRGKSPQQAGFFTRTARVRLEASLLAAAYCACGLVREEPAVRRTRPAAAGLRVGTLLCDVYDYYCTLVPEPAISFEHAVFLAECLRAGEPLTVRRCAKCHGLMVLERFPIRRRWCDHCLPPKGARTARGA